MKFLKEGEFNNKKVLVRCDFNVVLDGRGEAADDFRIVRTLPTIEFLADAGAIVVLMSHLEIDNKPASLKPVAGHLKKLLGRPVEFLNDCAGQKIADKINSAKPGKVILLENLRFHKEEKLNDPDFAQELARLGDCYVNDAFSVSHRAHASIAGVPKYLPPFAGLLLEEEIKNLQKILKKPKRPLAAVIGGVKVETKAPVIDNIAKIADHILVGSKIGALILAHKQQLGRRDLRVDPVIGKLDLTSSKIHLPIDGVLALKDMSEGYSRTAALGVMRDEEDVFDIGPETAEIFCRIIEDAKTIFFNGPMGMFEKRQFSFGTRMIIEAIAKNKTAYRIAGGGQTLEAIHKFKMEKGFDFLSTGGGALLEYLAGKELPGIKALEQI
jgi:3-phosphoglycerate kinase